MFEMQLFSQQQIHAQQLPHGPPGLPMGPHPAGPGAGLLGFPGANPPPHPLLKAAELHASREPSELKGPPSLPEDRLVNIIYSSLFSKISLGISNFYRYTNFIV